MKILFYISTIRGGGAARVIVNLANGLADKGYEVILVTNFYADHEYSLRNPIRRFVAEEKESNSNFIIKNTFRIKFLRCLIKREKPDVSISFMKENCIRLLIATTGLPTKTIISVRNDPSKEYSDKMSRWMAKLIYRKADGVVFQTEDAKAWFPKKIQSKARIIFNQVNERFFYENDVNGEYIMACGRLTSQKNYPMMIRAFAEVLKVFPGEQLRIYGEGNSKEDLLALIKELNIQSSVELIGFSTDIAEAYKHAKIFLLSSDYEGIPNAVLEAIASSVPVVCTDCPCGGPKMIIRDGENGYLVPVGDYSKMAQRIIELLSNPVCYKRMKQNAYHTGDLFRPDRVLQEWIDYIESV